MASLRTWTRKDGSEAHQVLFRDADTGKQTSKTFDDPAGADLLIRFLNAHGQSYAAAREAARQLKSKTPTVDATVARHIEHLTGVESGTKHRYLQLAKNHISGKLGSTPVDKVNRRQVLDWFDALPLGAKSKKNVHALLSAALESAVDAGHCPSNPAKGVRSSHAEAGVKKREAVFLSKTETDAIADAIDERFRVFIRTLTGSGLRFSEATALRRRDITINGGRAVLQVRRAWKKTDAGIQVGGPKTRKSRRTVALSPTLSKSVIDHMSGLSPDDLLFTMPRGGRIPNNRFHEKYWDNTVEELTGDGTLHEKPAIHDLRHSHASQLLEAGAAMQVVQARLGHESITTTISVYGHLASDADARAADLLD